MKYRSFTKDKLKVSQLGFGCMRFPILDGDNGKIDEKKASQMLDLAIEGGVNYIDTAFPYHNENSEVFLGQYFQKNSKREEIYLATKCPVWKAEKKGDFYKLLKLQLEKLQTNRIDFYLLHALDKNRWDKIVSLDVFEDMERAKEEGLIGYLGFSFHDEYEIFKEICDSYQWDFVQIQLNYMDINHQAGLSGLDYAYKKGLSLVIMEPIKGGKLANPPEEISSLFDTAEYKLSSAGHALAYLWDHEEVSVVLSGMSSLSQVEENLEVADLIEPDSLSLKDRDRYIEAKIAFDSRVKVDCSSCKYCMPCENGVDIPEVFSEYNDLHIYEDDKKKEDYKKLEEKGKGASSCTSCQECKAACPQHISIPEELKLAHQALTEEEK